MKLSEMSEKTVDELKSAIIDWKKDKGHTFIGVFHDINSAIKVGDEFVFMKDGYSTGPSG